MTSNSNKPMDVYHAKAADDLPSSNSIDSDKNLVLVDIDASDIPHSASHYGFEELARTMNRTDSIFIFILMVLLICLTFLLR